MLPGKYDEGVPPGSRGDTSRWLEATLTPANIERVKRLAPIAEHCGLSRSALALAWILHREGITSTITGATSEAHVAANVAASAATLDPSIVQTISEIFSTA